MSDITATVNSQPITASVNATGNISASVGSSVMTANAGGGIGPQGPQGVAGPPGNAISDASGLGSMATQASNNVSITGGSIDNLVIDSGTF